ncbi:MAG: NAD(P)-dependent oxidoreductase [Wenzhouxiangellaceae bacterium]|nr:NAD(P)-dependent oxidoreductase [Wenzhouxiangellaceae bacterium]
MPVVALTGATGFVGSALVDALSNLGSDFKLQLLVRNAAGRRLPETWRDHPIIDGSLNDERALAELAQDADHLVHVAAAIAGNEAADFEQANIVGTRRVIDALARSGGNAQLILISSLAARAPDLSWYAASKRAAEELVLSRHPRHLILRPPAVYGPADPALADFWRQLARGRLIRLGPARQRFSLLHVADLAGAILAALSSPDTRGVYELAGPQPDGGWSWPKLGQLAAQRRGRPVRTLALPPTLLRLAGALGPPLARVSGRSALLSPGKVRELQHHDWVCDNRAILHDLDWAPGVSLDHALDSLPGWSKQ